MLDLIKIEGFKQLSIRDAKTALDDYAFSSFGIKLNRQRAFDNMVLDLQGELLIKGYTPPVVAEDIKPEITIKVEPVVEMVKIEPVIFETVDIIEAVEIKPVDTREAFEVDEGFVPAFGLIGPKNGYYTLSWWILDWINANEDWKVSCKTFPRKYEREIMKTLAYYIKRDGFVTVRETRNSQFLFLK